MSEKWDGIVDQLLNSIALIADNRIAQNSNFDQTEICTIVDASQSDVGIYQVSYNNETRYEAYCNPNEAIYKEQDIVRVTIPNGDRSGHKYIEGKYAANSAEPVNYISPLDDLIIPNLEMINCGNVSIALNGDKKAVSVVTITGNRIKPEYNLRDIYNALYMTCLVQVYPIEKTHRIISGNYGVRLRINNDDNKILVFPSSSMVGNPYNFRIYASQQAKWALDVAWGDIEQIDIELYQDGEFYYLDGNNVKKYLNPLEVKFRDININFAGDITLSPDNKFEIYTLDDLSYNPEDVNITKNISTIWYNKSEDNEYIGYSDGRVYQSEGDPNPRWYDENEYLALLAEDASLLSVPSVNVPTDEFGRYAYRDYQKTSEILKQITKELNKLVTTVKNYRNTFSTVSGLNGILADLIDDKDSQNNKISLLEVQSNFNTKLKEFDTQYSNAFKRASAVQQAILQDDYTINSETHPAIDFEIDYFKESVNSARVINDCYILFQQTLLAQSEEDKIIAENLLIDFSKGIDKINNILFSLRDYIDGNSNLYIKTKLKAYQQVATVTWKVEEYISILQNEEFVKAYENYYSLYWYEKDEDYEDATDYVISKGWRRIGDQSPLPKNEGEKEGYLPIRPTSSDTKLKFGMETDRISIIKPTNTIKAILFFNHEKVESNELVFYNLKVAADNTEKNNSQGLIVNHGENSQEVYTCYNSYYRIKDASEGYKIRTLEAHYKYEKIGDENLAHCYIIWRIPDTSTMIIPNPKGTLNLVTKNSNYFKAGYKTYVGSLQYNQETGALFNNTFEYQIEKRYLATRNNNTIICEVHEPVHFDTLQIDEFSVKAFQDNGYFADSQSVNLDFAPSGVNGTPYTLIAEPLNTTETICYSDKTEHKIVVRLYNEQQEQIAFPSNPRVSWYQDIYKFNDEIKLEASGINYILTIKKKEQGVNYGIINFEVTVPLYDDTVEANGNTKTIASNVDISILYPIIFSNCASSNNCFLNCADRIIYNSMGTLTESGNYGQEALEFYVNNQQIKNAHISMVYAALNVNNLLTTLPTDGQFLPRIKTKTVDNIQKYYLEPSKVYSEYEKYIPIIKVVWDNYSYYQPLPYIQDVYGSEFLNNWNGSLSIDEENNTIMAAMIGAGIKTTENGFNGILMGTLSKLDDSSSRETGLFGYHNGAQSFGFNTDGTAFLGKSGHGRITFDGNKGIIQSGNYKTTTQTNKGRGMCIDLDDAWLETPGFKFSGQPGAWNDIDGEKNKWYNNYYFIAGNNESYLRFSKEYELEINVDRFSLTNNQVLGSSNLLRFTEPKSIVENNGIHIVDIDTTKDAPWRLYWNKWQTTIEGNDNSAFTVKEVLPHNESSYGMYQVILDEATGVSVVEWGKTYTYSAYLSSADEGLKLKIALQYATLNEGQKSVATIEMTPIIIEKTSKRYFVQHTFTLPDKKFDYYNGKLRIYFYTNNTGNKTSFEVYHPKLEEGTVATSWNPHPEDTYEQFKLYDSNIMTQNNLFNTLTDNGKTKGIWLTGDNQLYINASMLGASILRSDNFNGTVIETETLIYLKNEKGQYMVASDTGKIYYSTSYAPNEAGQYELHEVNGNKTITVSKQNFDDHYEILKAPKYAVSWSDKSPKGTLWDLGSGELWAAKFNLIAGTEGLTGPHILLNSNPRTDVYDYYFHIGSNADSNYISFDNNNKLTINVSEFLLKAGRENNTIAIDSAANEYPLQIGSNFKVAWDGKVLANSGIIGGIELNQNGLQSSGEEKFEFTYQDDQVIAINNSSFIIESVGGIFKANLTNSGNSLDNMENPPSTAWYNNLFRILIPTSSTYSFKWFFFGGSNNTEVGLYCPKLKDDLQLLTYEDIKETPELLTSYLVGWTRMYESRVINLNGSLPHEPSEYTKNGQSYYVFYMIINRKYIQNIIDYMTNKEFNFFINNTGKIKASSIDVDTIQVKSIPKLNSLGISDLSISKGNDEGSIVFVTNNTNDQLIYMWHNVLHLGTDRTSGSETKILGETIYINGQKLVAVEDNGRTILTLQ